MRASPQTLPSVLRRLPLNNFQSHVAATPMKPDSFKLNPPTGNDLVPNVRFNIIIGMLDGGFFGLGLGVASFVTVVPLFVNTLTSSAILIGLIPALHTIGWQLPQLFTAGAVSRLSRYKPMVLLMSINERVPFLLLAIVAYFSQSFDPTLVLIVVFLLLAWRGSGGGLTATAWQSMVAKIIPARERGKYFGLQSSTANLFASVGALASGVILARVVSPSNYALCFLLAGLTMGVSWFFLARTREPEHAVKVNSLNTQSVLKQAGGVLRRDKNFSWFIVARTFSQFATAATAFYTIYALRTFGMNPATAGVMTSVLLVTQIIANTVMGGLGDRFGHRAILILGTLAACTGALLAWRAPTLDWFYLIFILTGISGAALWTTSIAMTLEFSTETERPLYVGLANTLIAPAGIAAPIIGGWIADAYGFGMTFLFSVVCAAITAVILQFVVQDVRAVHRPASAEPTTT